MITWILTVVLITLDASDGTFVKTNYNTYNDCVQAALNQPAIAEIMNEEKRLIGDKRLEVAMVQCQTTK